MGATVDPDRVMADLHALSEFIEGGTEGWTRRLFSDAYRSSRHEVLRRMRDAGLEAQIDGAGNVVGRLAGSGASGALMTGSHTDTVHAGGRFDGVVGVVAGLEVARVLQESGRRLDHDLVVVDFLGEEANDYGVSCLGSRGLVGALDIGHLARRDERGVALGEALSAFGIEPHDALSAAWEPGAIAGYLELHIEQGPVLERAGTPIGVVTGIAGIERLLATFAGRADHAGTRPMDDRRDALLAAAEAALLVERTACEAPVHAVATSGRIQADPGAFNVVPERARLWSEVRSVDASWLHGARRDLARQIAEQAAARGVEVTVDWLSDQDPVRTSPNIQDLVASTADRLGLRWQAVPSGAGHDAAHLAAVAPTGMVFIPSAGGRSHVPQEWSETADIAQGATVLLETLVAMDGAAR